MTQRLKNQYVQSIIPKLTEQFKYKNIHEVPKIEKIVINRGIGSASQNQKTVEAALKELTQVKEKHKEVAIEISVEIGNPKYDVIEQAKKEEANYMVVGTHGRTGWSHALIGSTAEYIIRHSSIPVLVVPMKKGS